MIKAKLKPDYSEYFKNTDEIEKRMNKWLTNRFEEKELMFGYTYNEYSYYFIFFIKILIIFINIIECILPNACLLS